MRSSIRWLLPFLAIFHGCQLASTSLVDDVIDAIAHATDCDSCHGLLVHLKRLAGLGDSTYSSTFVAVCKTLGLHDDDICEGLLSQQAPIIAHGLRNISPFGQTATKLCEAMFGLCQPPEVNQLKFPLPVAPVKPKKWISKGRQPFQVVHFSDVHIDRQYTPGADAECTKGICCRNYADQAGQPIKVPAGPLGTHTCDTPTGLAESMLRAASIRQNSFSIFTGDVIEGANWLVNQSHNTEELRQFNHEMQTLMDAPVFPTIGNHESAPVNAFPRSTTRGASSQWVFDTQAAGWSEWLDATATRSVQHMSGSYSTVAPGTNLRIISINTNYWYKANSWLFDSDIPQPDPNGILAFVSRQLQVAEDAGQRAWVLAHMPPGTSDAFHDQSNYFDQIVQRYKNTIAGQFFGHTHHDQFAISYSDYKNRTAENAVSMMWIGPSLTPRSGNPAFKVYDVDPDTYEIMDAKVFISDMADPIFQTTPQWKEYYSAREFYGPTIPGGWPANVPLTPAFWHKVTEALDRDDNLFSKYLEFKTRGVNIEVCPPGDCKDSTICALRAGRAEDNCHITQPGLNFRKRGFGHIPGQRKAAADHCEGMDLGMVLSQMPIEMAAVNRDELKAKLKKIVPPEVAL